MPKENYQCVICCSVNTTLSFNSKDDLLNEPVNTNYSLLSQNLQVIFLLRKLLHVPSIQLENQLKECGSDPRAWIRLCEECTNLTKSAIKLEHEIQKIDKQLRSVQKQIVAKAKSSRGFQDNHDDLKTYHDRTSLTFEEKIRSFVKTHNYAYNYDDDKACTFLEGDKQAADYLAFQQNASLSKILQIGNHVKEEIRLEIEAPLTPVSSPDIKFTPECCSPEPDNEDVDKECTIKPKTKWKSKRKLPNDNEDTVEIKIKAKVTKYPKKIQKYVLCNCPHCGKQYATRKSLRQHVKNVHFKRPIKITCPICGQGLLHNRHKNIHMLSTHKDDPETLKLQREEGLILLRCSMVGCTTMFLKKDELDKHLENKHGGDDKVKWSLGEGSTSKISDDGQVLCGECGNWYRNWLLWRKHVWKIHDGRELICPGDDCELLFKVSSDTLKTFRIHFELSHEKKKITCNTCGKEMLNRDTLRMHKNKEHPNKKGEEGPWICDICGEEKNCYSSLRYHRIGEHKIDMKGKPLKLEGGSKKNEEKKMLCNLCGKEYRGQASLNKHVKFFHKKEFRVTCHVCGLAMPQERTLHIHLLRVHSEDPVAKQLETEKGLRLIKCEVVGCDGTFLRQGGLDKHMEKIHGGGLEGVANKFGCKLCGKVFSVRGVLEKHERVHEKDRNNGKALKCESCGKGFDNMHNLRRHRGRIHKF